MSISGHKLRQYVERLEALEDQKAALAEDIREVMAEARDEGFDPKVIRQVLKVRKMKPEERDEQEALIDLYLEALRRASSSEAQISSLSS